MRNDRRLRDVLSSALLALISFACRPQQNPQEIQPGRPLDKNNAQRIPWGMNSQDRFAIQPMGNMGKPIPSATTEIASTDDPFRAVYELPSGWSELPTSMMRMANFRVAGDERAECYLTLLAGDGGGLAANINRWRTQLSLEPMDEKAISALPQADFLHRQGVLVDFVGTWTGMGGMESKPSWRLIGILLFEPKGAAFLKMTGPDELIAKEKNHFLSLAKSLRIEIQEASTEAPSTPVTQNPAMGESEGLSWTAPSSWKKAPDKEMRVVTFLGEGNVECYLAVLPGVGGGELANFNRWRKQFGREELQPSDLNNLPRVSILGSETPWIEIEGSGDAAGKSMLGVVVTTKSRSLFVKMTGASESIKKEREHFLAFAQSIREAR